MSAYSLLSLNRTYLTPVLGKFLLYKDNVVILEFSKKSVPLRFSVTVETYWLPEPTNLWPSANRTYPNYSR